MATITPEYPPRIIKPNAFPRPPSADETIPIPNWNDIVHLKPNFLKTEAERNRERFEMFRRIQESQVPEWLQNYGRIMGYIENTEDYLSTAILIGRFLAFRVAPRLVPYLGWALLVSDILDLLGIFDVYGAATEIAKLGAKGMRDYNPFSHRNKTKRLNRLWRKLPGAGELIEAAQVTNDLFGIGIQFGPIVGMVEEFIVRAGQSVQTAWNDDPIQQPINQARRQLIESAFHMHHNPIFSKEQHQKIMIAQLYALGQMKAEYAFRDIDNQADFADVVLTPPPILNCELRRWLEGMGLDPDSQDRWAIPGAPKGITWSELAQEQSVRTSGAQMAYIEQTDFIEEEWFLGAMITAIARETLAIGNGGEDFIEDEYTLEEIALFILIERGIYPPRRFGRRKVAILIARIVEEKLTRGRWPTTGWIWGEIRRIDEATIVPDFP